MHLDSAFPFQFTVSYGGIEASGIFGVLFLALAALALYSSWRIMRRMGLSTPRMIVYLILLAIPFLQLWILWDVAHRPWPGQPEGSWKARRSNGATRTESPDSAGAPS